MIICAALKINKCEDFEETVVPCFRHGEGYKILHSLCQNTKYKGHLTEGFITHKGEFLDRKGALKHASICGQLSETCKYYKEDHKQNELFSEDLY